MTEMKWKTTQALGLSVRNQSTSHMRGGGFAGKRGALRGISFTNRKTKISQKGTTHPPNLMKKGQGKG